MKRRPKRKMADAHFLLCAAQTKQQRERAAKRARAHGVDAMTAQAAWRKRRDPPLVPP